MKKEEKPIKFIHHIVTKEENKVATEKEVVEKLIKLLFEHVQDVD